MNIGLKGLPVGDWRDLKEAELKSIYSLVEGSSSDVAGKSKKTSYSKKRKVQKADEAPFSKKSFSAHKSKTEKPAYNKFEKQSGESPIKKSRNAAGKPKNKSTSRRKSF